MFEDSDEPYLPPIVQLGDLDLDGNTDMVLVMASGNKFSKSTSYVKTFKGEKCSDAAVSIVFPGGASEDQTKNCRFFNHTAFNGEKSQYTSVNTLRTAFFDFGELGALSMISQTYNPSNRVTTIQTFFNFLNKNNYFLKSMARTHGRENGNSYIGLNFLAVRTEMDGKNDPVSCIFFNY